MKAEVKVVKKPEKNTKDIKFHFGKAIYKLRACGVIERNGKYLVDCTRINHFYSFPGGHIQIGENSEEATKREVLEETGIKTEVKNLIAITEVFLGEGGKKMLHEIDFHYLLSANDYNGPNAFYRTELDNGKKKKHNYKFMSIEEMKNKDIRPEHILSILQSKQYGQHVIQDKRTQVKE